MKRPLLSIISYAFAPAFLAGAADASTLPVSAAAIIDDAISGTADASLQTDTLPDLEVEARKARKELISSTPYHSIDAAKITTAGVTDIADALRRLPGINLRDYGGAGGLKTVSVRGLGARHTGVAYDGLPLTDIRSGEIDMSRYSLDNIGNLALTAGDTDDIFIPARLAATAATVSLTTLQPPTGADSGTRLTTRMRVGSFGFYNPFIHTGWSDGRRFSISATGDFTHADNDFPFTLRNGATVTRERRSNSDMNAGHGEINAVWKPKPGAILTAKAYYYDNNRRLPGAVVYYVVNPSNERLHDRNFFAQAQYRQRLSRLFSISGAAKFDWSGSHYTDRNGMYPGGKLDQNYLQREAYATATLLCTPAAGVVLAYSADWTYNNLNSNLPTDTHPYRNTVMQSLTAKWTVWRLTAMARGIYAVAMDASRKNGKGVTNDKLSPSLSLSLQPAAGVPLWVRASYKNIFRNPTFNELYFDNYGSLNLRPETTDQWNLGITWQTPQAGPLTRLELTADGYINMVRNKISAIPYNLFKWTMTNLGRVRIFGAEVTLDAELTLAPRHSLLLTGSYSYQRAQPRTDRARADWMKQVAYTPLNSGSGALTWMNPWVNLAVHLTGCSARYTTNNNLPGTRISGYAETGLAIFRTFPIGRHSLEARADVINLLDKQYEIVARYPMPGRSWTIAVGWTL